MVWGERNTRMEITKEDKRSVIDHCYLTDFYQRNGHPDLRCHSAKPDRGEKFKLYRGRRTAFLSGDRKFMFKPGISGILWDDVPEDGGSRTGGPLSGVPLPVYNGTSGPGALCDDLPDRNHEGA